MTSERYVALHRRMNELQANLPDRGGSPTLAHRLNQVSRWFPPPMFWLVLALVGTARPPAERVARAGGAVRGRARRDRPDSSLGLPAEPHYSVPVAPAFVLLAAGALLGPRRELRRRLADMSSRAGSRSRDRLPVSRRE